jgi:hypothetical protein
MDKKVKETYACEGVVVAVGANASPDQTFRSDDDTDVAEQVQKASPSPVPPGPPTPPVVPYDEEEEADYSRFTPRRKALFTLILSLCAVLAPFASTGCLTAVPDIAATFNTTGSVINVSNGLFTGAMGISSFFWGSLGSYAGRRIVIRGSIITFFAFSLGCALAPNLAAFYAFRFLSGFSGTGMMVAGPAVIGDLYRPVSLSSPFPLSFCH